MPNWKKLIVSGSSAELTTLKLTGLSAGTPTTALMLDGSGNVEKRTLGSNAFNSTAFATGDNFDEDGTFAALRAGGTTKGDVGLGNVENTALSTYTGNGGALDNQYITNGANYVTAGVTLTTAAQPNITSLGTLTTLTVDDITINGSTISDAGSLTLDIGGDLNIDVDGADIVLKDGGTAFGRFKRDTSDFIIKSETQDKDIIFRGNDGGSSVDALTLDMSGAGYATFNAGLNAGGAVSGVTRLTVDNIDLNGQVAIVGTTGVTNSEVRVVSADTSQATLSAYGDSQGTGRLYVGQSSTYGGGVVYNGDDNPDITSTTDKISFYRRDNGTDTEVFFYGYNSSTVNFKGDVVAFYSSDERLKTNIKPIENTLDKIGRIGGYNFDWVPKEGIHEYEGSDIGVIAQEIEKEFPELVITREDGYKAVKYDKLSAVLLQAVKDLTNRVQELEKKL